MKNKKGITLIALVITIIILLILAAVAIQLALGENGLIGRAQSGQEKQTVAEATEKFKTLQAAAWADYVVSNRDGDANEKYVDALNAAVTASTAPNIKNMTASGTFAKGGSAGSYTITPSTVKLQFNTQDKVTIAVDANGNVTFN